MTNPCKHIISVNEKLYSYMLEVGVRENPVLTRLRERTDEHILGGMQMTPDQGAFLQMLIRLTGARRVIEVGVYTGTGTLAMALALPDTGRILACDFRDDFTSIGEPFWREAGVSHKIDLRLARAEETLSKELEAGNEGVYDFAFVDADKERYDTYYEQCLSLVRSGGLVCLDNTLWRGAVVDPEDNRPTTTHLRIMNDKISRDSRVDICILPVADGMTLVRKK